MKKLLPLILFITSLFGGQYLAVLDLEPESINESEARILTQRLTSRIIELSDYTVVERANIDKILNEQKFQHSGCTDSECAVEIGQLLNADITVVGMSYMNTEALIASKYLTKQGISCELLDLRSVNPIDWSSIIESVKKTKRLIVLDTGSETGSLSAEIIAKVSIKLFSDIVCPPARICLPNVPVPASFALTEKFYPTSYTIAEKISLMLGKAFKENELEKPISPHDIPGDWFKGPF